MTERERQTETNYRIEAVDCAIDVLMAVSNEADLGMSEIARKVGGSRQRIFRMLKTLESRGLIEKSRDGKSFRLGYLSLVMGNAAKAQMDIIRLAEPIMREIGLQVEETIQIRIREGWESICVGRWEPERDVRVHAVIGRRRPLHAGSSTILLAYMPKEQQEIYLNQQLPSFTPNTQVDPDVIRARLADIRAKGFSISRGEVSEDLVSISAPVFGADKTALAVVNIAAPAARLDSADIDHWISVIVDGAIQISRMMGYPSKKLA